MYIIMEIYRKIRLKELKNKEFFEKNPEYTMDYPHLDDPQLQRKLSVKKEFRLYKYDGTIEDVETKANQMCKKNKVFELSPHQEFIKRFVSYQTPYNGVLLFHGLGSGKTCSAIGITEAIRSYSKYVSDFKKILIIASPNVQENFRLQLFNPSKLEKVNNSWTLSGCLGNSLIQELNVYQINNLTKEDLISKINKIISKYYEFLGYIEFANRIERLYMNKGQVNIKIAQQKLKAEFEGSLIIIDEIHNIRQSGNTNKGDKKSASSLFKLVTFVKFLKIIFLTGTPMYNDPKEILYILNILNINDNRSPIGIKEIFDKNDEFIEGGEDLFKMKANGYVSYVRGENPYIFPYLITPFMYKSPFSIRNKEYPRRQFNNKRIENPIQYLDLFLSKTSPIQQSGYEKYLSKVTDKFSDEDIAKFEDMESFRYNEIMAPIQSLNIVYPIRDTILLGEKGLNQVMRYDVRENPPSRGNYEYTQLNGMFTYDKIGEYSSKIKVILDHIIESKGIILIYSQYIDGGIIPMALALEELGFIRYKNKNLFKKRRPPLSINNLKREKKDVQMVQATYSIICGDKMLSPNTNDEIEALTNNNVNGERVKVVIISQSGSEGIDLNHIRQVHIMEPWYNMNRLEQIIGRARRNCSHAGLPLTERNVQIFLHATDMGEIESMDMYLYRLSEKKSIKIGRVTRLLKSVSVDCLLNKEQQAFYKMDQKLDLTLSEKIDGEPIVINRSIRDEAYTSLCDYMDTCEFECINEFDDSDDISTYQYSSTKNNRVIDIIKDLFKQKHVYKKNYLLDTIKRKHKGIHLEEILRALRDLEINTLVDKFGRQGYLINTADIYFFQPIEIKDKHISMTERTTPLTSKKAQFTLEVENKESYETTKSNLIEEIKERYELALKTDSGEDSWYAYFDEAAGELMEDGIRMVEIEDMLMQHICDELSFEEELEVLNYISSTNDTFNVKFKSHFEKSSIEVDDLQGQVLYDHSSSDPVRIYVLNDTVWEPAGYTDKGILMPLLQKKIVRPKGPFFSIVGFMGKSKNGKIFEFKIKDSSTKFTGAVVENKPKDKIIEMLNETLQEHEIYNKKNTASTKKQVLVIIEEFLLRYYDRTNKNKMRYFLSKLEYYYLQKN